MNIRDYFKKAQKEKWAIGQFNISNLETLRAIVKAAQNLKSPIIIGTSEGESKFIGLREAVALVASFRKEYELPIFLNLDHGKDFDYIKEVIDLGYDAVHFDGSKLTLEENIKMTKRVVEYAHEKKVFIEGEVGFIKGASEILKEIPEMKEEDLTSPEEALKFIRETGVDSLAINVGTFHGMGVSGRDPNINLKRLKEIKDKVGEEVFLVLHGGSGTQEEDIRKAIELGIVKININTELRAAFTNALGKSMKDKPEEITPYKYLSEAIIAVQKTVEEKIKLFGSVNKI
jgi:ketose-bisphosphate aldolase